MPFLKTVNNSTLGFGVKVTRLMDTERQENMNKDTLIDAKNT